MIAAALVALTAATATAPPVTLTGQLGFVTLASAGGCSWDEKRALCGDPPAPQYLPGVAKLAVTPGEQLSVTITEDWSAAPTATFSGTDKPLALKAAGPLSYRLTLPGKLTPVSYLSVFGRWAIGKQGGDAIYFVRLESSLPARVSSRAVRLADGRIRWSVSCPKRAGAECAGFATLRTPAWRTVVRESYADLKPGATRTFTSAPRITAPAQLRGTVSQGGQVTRVRLR